MRDIEVENLRKHILKEVYSNTPFNVVSGGISVAVVVSPTEYNRLKLIEHVEKINQKYHEKINILMDRLTSNNLALSPEE